MGIFISKEKTFMINMQCLITYQWDAMQEER
jgi:hypothetical protein